VCGGNEIKGRRKEKGTSLYRREGGGGEGPFSL